jgi:hypothetical protein
MHEKISHLIVDRSETLQLTRRLEATALSGYWACHVRWRDEEIEIALSRSPFSSRGHQLRRTLVFSLSVELARHRRTTLRARRDRDIRDDPVLVR